MEFNKNTAEKFVIEKLADKGSFFLNGYVGDDFYQFEYKVQKSEAAKKLELLENGLVEVPRWMVYFSIPILIFLVAFFTGALVTMGSVKRDGIYGESCVGRSCSKEQNLKCINKICQCESPKYFTNKCVDLSKYGEKCVGRENCDPSQDLICFGSLCSCAPTKYWNSQLNKCVDRLTYGQSCSGDQCRIRVNMICNSNRFCDCVDNNLYYWDENVKECVAKKRYSLPCTSEVQCLDSELTICKNDQFCLCPDIQYFNGINCVNRVGEFENCTFDDMCMSPMFCSVSSRKCTCATYHYYDASILNCVEQHSNLQGPCNSDHHCRQDKLLYCDSGTCRCLADNTWSSTADTCKLTYLKGDCSVNSDCNLEEYLICYRPSYYYECDCPTESLSSKCDCPRTSSTEMYWDLLTTKCIEAKTYGNQCSNLYECKHITQKLICDVTCTCEEPGGWVSSRNICKKCKTGDFFLEFSELCYHFSTNKERADRADNRCRDYGARLARIDDFEILNFLTGEVVAGKKYWIDGVRKNRGSGNREYRFYDSGSGDVPSDICSDYDNGGYTFLHLRESISGDWCFYSDLSRWTETEYICQY